MSNKRIFKYEIPLLDRSNVTWPLGGELLDVQIQHGEIQAWVMVEPTTDDNECRKFSVVGTGHPVPADAGDYVKTVQAGAFVWHIFMATEASSSPGE
jgi:hypothetical protein